MPRQKIPAYSLIVVALLSISGTYFVTRAITPPSKTISVQHGNKPTCNRIDMVQLTGYKYVDPLLYAERDCESETLQPLEEEIGAYIEEQKESGRLTAASVYVKTLDDGEWTDINPDEQYHPASLLKLPVLFTFAKMAERDPKILDIKVPYKRHDASLPAPMFPSKSLTPGQTYTIRELLLYLIAYSDNDALFLLYNYHDPKIYTQLFSDLSLPMPDQNRDNANITVKQYSTYLKVLYNGTYLSLNSSEFALSYLVQADFKEGIVKGLPANTTVAHKFGEYYRGNVQELHESAIVYLGNKKNYLITVMTRGNDMHTLADAIGNISQMVYTSVSRHQ